MQGFGQPLPPNDFMASLPPNDLMGSLPPHDPFGGPPTQAIVLPPEGPEAVVWGMPRPAPQPPQQQELSRSLLPPFWLPGAQSGFALGTDLNGRDLLSRIMTGARSALFVGITSVFIGGSIGLVLGLLVSYLRTVLTGPEAR